MTITIDQATTLAAQHGLPRALKTFECDMERIAMLKENILLLESNASKSFMGVVREEIFLKTEDEFNIWMFDGIKK